MSTRIAPGVVQIDTLLGGWQQVTAGYLITDPTEKPAGTSADVTEEI